MGKRVNLTPKEAEELVRRRKAEPVPRGMQVVYISEPIVNGLKLWLPGRLRNPLNERKLGNGFAWDRYKRKWQQALDAALKVAGYQEGVVDPKSPKTVTMSAWVFNRFDSHDGLRAALKPVPDGLKKAGLIDDDRDSSGHEFNYWQGIDRRNPGVVVVVKWACVSSGEDTRL